MTLTINLPEEEVTDLAARASERGVSAEEYARLVLEQDLKSGPEKPRRHIPEVILDNVRDVPPEVMADMPADGASEHDHYIYGLPKRNG